MGLVTFINHEYILYVEEPGNSKHNEPACLRACVRSVSSDWFFNPVFCWFIWENRHRSLAAVNILLRRRSFLFWGIAIRWLTLDELLHVYARLVFVYRGSPQSNVAHSLKKERNDTHSRSCDFNHGSRMNGRHPVVAGGGDTWWHFGRRRCTFHFVKWRRIADTALSLLFKTPITSDPYRRIQPCLRLSMCHTCWP